MSGNPNWVTTPSTDALLKAIDDAIAAIRPCSRDNAMAGEGLFHVQIQLENARRLMPMHLLHMPGPGLVSVRQTADGGIALNIADQPAE